MDYWVHLDWNEYNNVDEWIAQIPDKSRVFLMSSHASKSIYDIEYQDGDWLVFGKETKGLAPEILQKYPSQNLTIPIIGPARSLNLATAVAIALYEGVRQLDH